MDPIRVVYLTDLGPNKTEVLRALAPQLGQNYLNIVRQLAAGPVLVCAGGIEVWSVYRKLEELGAGVMIGLPPNE